MPFGHMLAENYVSNDSGILAPIKKPRGAFLRESDLLDTPQLGGNAEVKEVNLAHEGAMVNGWNT